MPVVVGHFKARQILGHWNSPKSFQPRSDNDCRVSTQQIVKGALDPGLALLINVDVASSSTTLGLTRNALATASTRGQPPALGPWVALPALPSMPTAFRHQ